MITINRGSEWRRWEMHLHTPETKKEDCYEGKDISEKWDKFYSSISDYIGDGTDPTKAICAIAITDYLSIDNYFKVIEHSKLPACVKLVMPNVELRMSPLAKDSPINIHCIFDPSIARDLESRFFSKLVFKYDNSSFNATKSELIRLGKKFLNDDTISDDKAYYEGLNQFIVSFSAISEVFSKDSDLRDHTIIAVSNKSSDGASGLRTHSDYFTDNTSQLEATRRSIYQLSDMIYSSNPKDVAYFLGEGPDDSETVISKCGSLMPCIHGSDAHSNERVFAPVNDRFCWIKADPTFEGFKQIIYEPKERVRISATIPDSKPSYYIIDHVEIKGNEKFSPEPICFSDKLTCIIGGKSTGKSLLLHNIATAIDKEQVVKKQETAKTNVRELPELKVYWLDGVCSSNMDNPRKIVYIPQTYLNRLSDEEQETTEIDTIIQDIILQNPTCNNAFEQMLRDVADKKQDLAKAIVDFLRIVNDIQRYKNECKEIGNKESIEIAINQMESQMDSLSKEFDVTEEEITIYQSTIEELQSLRDTKAIIIREIDILGDYDTVVEKKALNTTFTKYDSLVNEGINATEKAANTVWAEHRQRILETAHKDLQEIGKTIEEKTTIIDNLKPKIDGNEQISDLSSKIVSEKAKLLKLIDKLSQLETLQAQYNEKLTWLSNVFESFRDIYKSFVDCINTTYEQSTDDLEFSAKKVFRIDQLKKKLEEVLDNRSISRFNAIEIKESNEQSFSPDKLKKLIESILDNSSSGLQLKRSYSIESGLREILSDWYNVDYTVKMDNDPIQDMSPGKKALVLLRLLISLADSKCPILIDQPEDDLDNRSIFDELIGFIREKKISRQIITVTHNANIVLGGDAEQVIVANQNGNNSPNNSYQFEYRGGSIEDNLPIYDDNGHVRNGILNQKGMQEHICEILEGGKRAFDLRRHKYQFIDL